MWMRSVGLGVAALLLALTCGCNPSGSNDAKTAQEAKAPGPGNPFKTVGSLHWLGKKKLAADTNATHFLSIWNLPEAGRLQDQTLNKLATAIASGFSYTNSPTAVANRTSPLAPKPAVRPTPPPPLSPTASLIRPLLTDLVEEESYFEVGSATNQPGELLLAIRLGNDRAGVWQTNLASALNKLLTTNEMYTNGQYAWDLSQAKPRAQAGTTPGSTNATYFHPESVHLDRAGDWTILSLACGPQAPLLSNVLAKIKRDGTPFTAPATNYWIDTSFDLPAIARTLSLNWHLPTNWPKIACTVHGEGENVRTLGQLEFTKPLPIQVTPWSIPTNLVHDPLTAFTAARGIGPLLLSLPEWEALKLSSAPGQIYIWAQAGMPALEYVAAKWQGSDKVVGELSKNLPELVNPWLRNRTMGYLTNQSAANGLVWQGAPFVQPGLTSIVSAEGQFVLAGLLPVMRTNQPPPEALLSQVSSDNHDVLYSWEVTGPRIGQLLYVTQLARLISKKAQLSGDSASIVFLKAAASKLGNCVSIAAPADGNQIVFSRKSSCPLAAFELLWLADWLESPTFPVGFHTTVAPPPTSPFAGGTRH